MRRRDFIMLAGGAALAAPLIARAQSMRRVGVLMGYDETDTEAQRFITGFREELSKGGWKEGKNVQLDYRWATTNVARLQHAAQELVPLKPDVILSSGTPGTAELLKLTRTIPIVFAVVVDPVGSGFVASLPKPGGNVTGFINLDPKVAGKWVELLKEIAPRITRAAVTYNPNTETYAHIYLPHFEAAAAAHGMTIHPVLIRSAAEIEPLIAEQLREPNTGLIPMPGGFMSVNRKAVVDLAARYKAPAVYYIRQFVEAGGLLSYGIDNADNYRQAGSYVDRILKGEKPADLPVQFPTKFELAVNLKTAKAIGIDVPLFLQQRADTVVE
jgi:putative ABC transport system substrate-binding protein